MRFKLYKKYVAKCRYPLPYSTTEMELLPVIILGHNYYESSSNWSAMEGTTVLFTCSNDYNLKLIGPKSSTCMKNGEWEPDPRGVECRQKGNMQLI